MHNVKILALLLICTLAISMGSTLGIARGLIIKPPTPLPTSPFTSQESADEAQAKQLIDQSFIDMFGLQSDLTAVTSDVNFCNTTSQEAYTYNATFVPSQGSSYAVELSLQSNSGWESRDDCFTGEYYRRPKLILFKRSQSNIH